MQNDRQVVLWMNCISEQTLTTSYSYALQALELYCSDATLDDMSRIMQDWVGSQDRNKVFIILDDLDDKDLFQAYLKGLGAHQLITTRDRAFAISCTSEHIEVGTLTREESSQLLRLQLGDNWKEQETHRHALEEVSFTMLNGHPLAIAQAASHIRRRHITLEEYIRSLRNFSDNFDTDTSWGRTVSVTFEIVFKRLNTTAVDLLTAFSVLGAESCPLALANSVAFGPKAGERGETLFWEAFEELSTSALVRKDDDGRFTTHRLVQETFLNFRGLIHTLKYKQRALRVLSEMLSADINDENESENKILLQHATKVVDYPLDREADVKARVALFQKMSRCAWWFEDYTSAEQYAQDALDESDIISGVGSDRTLLKLSLTHDLAAAYQGQGQYGRAKALYEWVLAGRTKILGESHPDTRSAQNCVTTCLVLDDKELP